MPARKKSINDLIDQRMRLAKLASDLGRRYNLESKAQDRIDERINNIRNSKSYQKLSKQAKDLRPLGDLGLERRQELANKALNRKYSANAGSVG